MVHLHVVVISYFFAAFFLHKITDMTSKSENTQRGLLLMDPQHMSEHTEVKVSQ